VRIWPLPQPGSPIITELPAGLNAVATAPDGEIAAAGADGRIYFLSPTGQRLGAVEVFQTSIVALSITRDGARIAAAGIDGSIAVIDRKLRRAQWIVTGTSAPVWAVAFLPDGGTLLSGGSDRTIRRWNAAPVSRSILRNTARRPAGR
jgi:cytochrome c